MARHKVGTVDRQGVFIRIEYPRNGSDKPALSICADIYRGGHDVGGGQSLDTVRRVATHGHPSKEWPVGRILYLLAVWDHWHLNDVQAGCSHQREMGWRNYDKHPGEPCPICGYKYGSAWLYAPLPQDVIDFVQPLV